MARRRPRRRSTRRLAVLAGVVGAVAAYRNWAIARYEAQHPELFT